MQQTYLFGLHALSEFGVVQMLDHLTHLPRLKYHVFVETGSSLYL
jgi:hypothetical protein